jgi:hypothetical protein
MFGPKTANFPRDIRAHFTLAPSLFIVKKIFSKNVGKTSTFRFRARSRSTSTKSDPKIPENSAFLSPAHFTHGQITGPIACAR